MIRKVTKKDNIKNVSDETLHNINNTNDDHNNDYMTSSQETKLALKYTFIKYFDFLPICKSKLLIKKSHMTSHITCYDIPSKARQYGRSMNLDII